MALGAGILSTGGGGSPFLAKKLLQNFLHEHPDKKIQIYSPESFSEDDTLTIAGFFGAPTVLIERLGSVKKLSDAIQDNN
mmetsp:Transcript_3307/g.2859  ORF Transcript_3307/g.2859 Transcript_3307/m.2859 type:complete len:80 (-) Transcript_3307:975-1214(-)